MLKTNKPLGKFELLQLADRISSIVVLKIVYFLASRNMEVPGPTVFSKRLLLSSSQGLGLTLASSFIRNLRSV